MRDHAIELHDIHKEISDITFKIRTTAIKIEKKEYALKQKQNNPTRDKKLIREIMESTVLLKQLFVKYAKKSESLDDFRAATIADMQ